MLTPQEADVAYAIGEMRNDHSIERGLKQAGTYKRHPNSKHADGMAAIAEATVAKLIGRTWLANWERPDRGFDIQGCVGVKWTVRGRGCLIVKPRELDTVPQVLTVGEENPLRVVGWMMGWDAKRDWWWKTNTRDPAWFVPQECLHPIADLVRMLDRERACNRIWSGGAGVVGGILG
jgi:hypothetical protein